VLLSLSARIATILLFAVISVGAHADEIPTLNSTTRALGMGDAFTALSNDSSALFYNPAGLAKVHGLNMKIMDIKAGASGIEAYNKIKGMNGASGSGFADKIEALYGEHVWTGVGGDMAFTMPMFGFGVYDHAGASVRVDNPVYPQVNTNVINDYGYVVGTGVPLSPFLQAGVNLRYVKRTGARLPFGAAFLADLDPKEIYSKVTGWGRGYGMDLGVNAVLPAPFFQATLSAAWKNVGQMRFSSDDPNANIPYEDNDLTLGAALLFDLPLVSIAPAVDVRYLTNTNYQLTRKINFGIEVGLPLIDIRGGFHEGYYTYGVGMNMGLFRVDAASYGVELGAYPGQIQDRRYMLEFTMELGVGNFSADGSSDKKKGSGGSGGGSGGGSSGSFWGSGGKLKARR
jgi:uncharacterized membrane protein YgcG